MDQLELSLKRKLEQDQQEYDTKNDLKALMSSGPFQSKLARDEDTLTSEILYYAKTLEPLQRWDGAPSEFTNAGLLATGLAERYISNAKQMIQTEQKYDAEYRVFYHSCDQGMLLYEINSIIAQAVSTDPHRELPPIFRLMMTPFESMKSTDDLTSTLSVYESTDHDTAFNKVAISANGCMCPAVHDLFRRGTEANPLAELASPAGYCANNIGDPLRKLLNMLYNNSNDRSGSFQREAQLEIAWDSVNETRHNSSSHVMQIFCKEDIVNNLCYEAAPFGFPIKYTKSPLHQKWTKDDTPLDEGTDNGGDSSGMPERNMVTLITRPITRQKTQQMNDISDRSPWPLRTPNHKLLEIPSSQAASSREPLKHASSPIAIRSLYNDTLPRQAWLGTYWERLHSDKNTVRSQARIYVHPQWFGGNTFGTQSPSYWSGGTQIRVDADSRRPKTPEVMVFQYTTNPVYDRHKLRQAIRDIIGAYLTPQNVPSIRMKLGLPTLST